MLFDNEEERLEFHKANSIMQALAGAFEALCFSYGIQVRLYELRNENNAILKVPLKPEALTELECIMNNNYPRIDKIPSAHVIDLDNGLISIYGVSGKDLSTLV